MLESRKAEVDNLVGSLCARYDVATVDGLKQIGQEHGIIIICDRRVVIDCIVEREGVEHIFVGKSPFQSVRKYGLAHELGHALIDQEHTDMFVMELEVDYFAESLVGPAPLIQTFATTYYRMIVNPLGCLRYFLDIPYQHRGYYEYLLRLARSSRQ